MAVNTSREDGALDVALSKLRELIVGGVLLPGEQIRQQEMAEQMGVSRVPLREALNVLASQGLLLHRPHQGYFVAKRLPIELAQIRRMLQMLEDELLRSLVWPDEECLAELQTLNDQMEVHAQQEDWMPLLSLNRQFHFRMFELSPYRLILDHVERLWDIAEPFISNKLTVPEARWRTCQEHRKMIEALRRRDRAACIALLDEHRSSHASGLHYELPAHVADKQFVPQGAQHQMPAKRRKLLMLIIIPVDADHLASADHKISAPETRKLPLRTQTSRPTGPA
jgi:DNA-binding GntR family transcriptional regulator